MSQKAILYKGQAYISPGSLFVPTKLSQLQNDVGYITSASIPTNVSAFTNDAGYLTSHQDISGKVNKSGDTMTGELVNTYGYITLKNTTLDLTKSNNGLSNNLYRYYKWTDKNNKISGYFENYCGTDGYSYLYMCARNYKTDGTSIDNAFRLRVAKDGTKDVYVTDAAAWRSALGLGTMATASTGSYVAKSGDTMSGKLTSNYQQAVSWLSCGKNQCVHINNTGATGWIGGNTATGRMAICTYASETNNAKLYFNYYTNSTLSGTENKYDRTMTWDGGTGVLKTGALSLDGGRVDGSGDDEGIVVHFASNNWAGVCLGTPSGRRSVFYLNSEKAFWRYNNGTTSYDINHPGASGTIALTSSTVANATKWNNVTDDHGTANTTDTWIPVYASSKIQHCLRSIWSSKQHSNYNNNQDNLVTLSCLSYWNGAYNSGGNSNLTYCTKGAFGNSVVKDLSKSGARFNCAVYTETDGTVEIGRYLDWHDTSGHTGDYHFRMRDDNGTAVTSGPITQNSSRKIKTNIEPMEQEEADKILTLEAVKFDYIRKGTDNQAERGFIAEEVEPILPNLITPEEGEEGTPLWGPMGLNYIEMIPYLVMVCQRQQREINELREICANCTKNN